MDVLGQFLKNGNFKLVGQDSKLIIASLFITLITWPEPSVVNKIIDELMEEISSQIKSAGLDPLQIPDINLPFSMEKVGWHRIIIFSNE